LACTAFLLRNFRELGRFLRYASDNDINFLGQKGIVTLLTMSQHGFLRATMGSPLDASYLVDVVVVLRYYEVRGVVHKTTH
jgi:hypothetical protein